MQLQETIQDQLNKLIDNGTVEKIISDRLTETIKETMNDLLRGWSDFGKQLKEAVSKSLNINLEKLSFMDYNTIVSGIVKEHLDKSLAEHVAAPIEEMIKSYTGGLEKKEWKLSEVIEKFIKQVRDDSSDIDGEIYIHVEESDYGSYYVYFDEDKNTKPNNCEYRLYIDAKSKKIFSFQAGNYKPFTGDLRQQPVHSGFDSFIFKLWAYQAKIDIDESDCENKWSKID